MKAFTIPILVFVTVTGVFAKGYPAKRDIIKDGYFCFPQNQARVLHKSSALRLSAWSNDTLLYVQAILWNDCSSDTGAYRDGRQDKDYSILSLDVDADASITPLFDRNYFLDPWPSMNGMYYAILLDKHFGGILKSDSTGTGSICYVHLQDGKVIRIDNYVIPLKEIGKQVGERIRICYWAASAIPDLKINSAGVKPKPGTEKYWHLISLSWRHIPFRKYHDFRLTNGKTVTLNNIVETWAQESDIFTKSKEIDEIKKDWFDTDRTLSTGGIYRLNLQHNKQEVIRKELLNRNFLKTLGVSLSLDVEDVAKLQLKYDFEYERCYLSQNGAYPSIFQAISLAVRRYTRQRHDGHTKEYALASLNGRWWEEDIKDSNLPFLLKDYPEIPPGWLKKDKCRTFSANPNRGERCVAYFLIDGKIAWTYELIIKLNGASFCKEEKRDAKEYDSEYRLIIWEAENQARRKMKERGVRGLGSIHAFWRLKKEYLKKKGVNWRSPAELNPNAIYD